METRRASIPSMMVAVWLLAAATPAHAYLDPSTGSMILSAVIGLLATLALALKTYWYRLRALFRRAEPPPRSDLSRDGELADGDGSAAGETTPGGRRDR
jgi:hypothetical protein